MRRVGAMPEESPLSIRPTVFLLVALLIGCSLAAMPNLEIQKEQIRRHDLQLWKLTPEAFFEAWGPPAYVHEGSTQFYPQVDGQYVPSFRVPLGEVPKNWDSTVVTGLGRFFAYPEQGELLGFFDNRLAYREPMSGPQVHALGKAWAREQKFRTTIESDMVRPR
jgi:hypothetical protein